MPTTPPEPYEDEIDAILEKIEPTIYQEELFDENNVMYGHQEHVVIIPDTLEEAKAAITQMLIKAQIAELKRLSSTYESEMFWDIGDRLIELNKLLPKGEDDEN